METTERTRPKTPLLAVDIACIWIDPNKSSKLDQIVLIERQNEPVGVAFPGGMVDCGETILDAASRELEEETDLVLVAPRQLRIFDDPKRDPRDHVISVLVTGYAYGTPKAGSDAKAIKLVHYKDLMNESFVFDHAKLAEYFLKYDTAVVTSGWDYSRR